MKNNIIVPENVRPAIIAPPKPLHKGSDKVIGISPMMVAKEVRKIGSILAAEASAIASLRGIRAFLF